MRLTGPERYRLAFDAERFAVTCPQGTPRFSELCRSKQHKLYVASTQERPIYVGITQQDMRARLRYGWKASGANGYHGYAWRRALTEAELDIWVQQDPAASIVDLETIEAEVVFLIRTRGQWPLYQTEIHFHPSTEAHRAVAQAIVAHYFPATAR